MPTTITVVVMIEELAPLLHTTRLTFPEARLVDFLMKERDANRLDLLTGNHVARLTDLHRKHFAT